MVSPVALFFAAFAAPSAVLAFAAAREFHYRGAEDGARRVRRARGLMVLAGALPVVMVALTTYGTGGAPLALPGGWVFLGYGAACGILGLLGAWLYARAAADPRRKWRKAAETAPMVLAMLDLVLVVNALTQLP